MSFSNQSVQPNTPHGFRTLDELEHYTYGRTPEQFIKASGGIGTDTTGVYNPIYGAMIWANFNLEANVFGLMSKYIWDYSGWRIFDEKADSLHEGLSPHATANDSGTVDNPAEGSPLALAQANNTDLGGTLEGGKIAQPIRPEVKEISVRPKIVQYAFESSEVQEHLTNNSRDDLWGSLAHQKVYSVNQMKENLNKMLLYNTRQIGTNTVDDASRKNIETLDRIVSSKEEQGEYGTTATRKYNPWINLNRSGERITTTGQDGLTRSSSDSTKDAYDTIVTSPGATLDESDIVTSATIRDFLSDIRPAGGKDPTLFIGGHKLYNELQGTVDPAIRFMNPSDMMTSVQISVNGIKTFKGTGTGLHIRSFYDIPFIPTKDAPIGASSGTEISQTDLVSNLYAFDASDPEGSGKPRIGIQVLKPIVYYEASHRIPPFPFTNGAFVDKGIFQTIMEATCQMFRTQGKIINIRRSAG